MLRSPSATIPASCQDISEDAPHCWTPWAACVSPTAVEAQATRHSVAGPPRWLRQNRTVRPPATRGLGSRRYGAVGSRVGLIIQRSSVRSRLAADHITLEICQVSSEMPTAFPRRPSLFAPFLPQCREVAGPRIVFLLFEIDSWNWVPYPVSGDVVESSECNCNHGVKFMCDRFGRLLWTPHRCRLQSQRLEKS